jgi:hypothetical protein
MSTNHRPKRNKPNATGRSPTDRFVRLSYKILECNAYRSLTPNERSLLVELTMLYNSKNNGELFLSVRDAAARMGVVDLTAAARAFDTLQDLGFIQMTLAASFSVKGSERSRARCWRLNWLPGPGRRVAMWEFFDREPVAGSRERCRMEAGQKALKRYKRARNLGQLAVSDSDTLGPHWPIDYDIAVLESDTPNGANGGNP